MSVYFIAENENDDHNSLRVKIGRSGDIQVRLRTLQTGSPYDLKLMGWIESNDNRTIGSTDSSLSHYRNRQRVISLQIQ